MIGPCTRKQTRSLPSEYVSYGKAMRLAELRGKGDPGVGTRGMFNGFPHQPSYAALKLSGDTGCDICRLFRETIVQSWDKATLLMLHEAGTKTSVVVQNDLRLPGEIITNDFEGSTHLTIEVLIELSPKILGEYAISEDFRNPIVKFQIFAYPGQTPFL